MPNKPSILTTMLFGFCVLCATIQSCNEVQIHNVTTSAIDKKTDDTLSNTAEDTAKPFANYYTFNTELDTEQNIRAGWVDTFAINNRRFMFFRDSSQALKVEFYKDYAWHTNVDGNNFTIWDFGLGDVNSDGYKDLVIGHRRGMYINFYNPAINMFDTITWDMRRIDSLLDNKTLTHYNFWEDDAIPMTSELYTFKGIKPYYYYILKFVHGKYDTDNRTDGFIGLWKCKNGDEDIIKATLVKKIKYDNDAEKDEFDYAKFWANNYRRLIKQYDH